MDARPPCTLYAGTAVVSLGVGVVCWVGFGICVRSPPPPLCDSNGVIRAPAGVVLGTIILSFIISPPVSE